jgi:sulfide:quinone oxidoreductase
MSGFRVLVCGGGIAGIEGLLRLRRLTGDALELTLLAPADELRYRPMAVQEPFSRPGPRRYPLWKIAGRAGAEWVQSGLEWVDPDGQQVHTTDGHAIPYDALLLAVGARTEVPYEHVTMFDDAQPDETYRGVVQDVEGGYTSSVALLLPDGPAWPLPAYELALMTAERAYSMGMDEFAVDVITAEPEPLAAFGHAASEALQVFLAERGVQVHARSQAEVPASRKLIIRPAELELERGRIVAMPRIVGPRLRGVPANDNGFIPIDERCGVRGLAPRVFAAGDAADLEVKQGGLGAQMADTAAAAIAALAGANVEVEPLQPVIHGVLYTGAEPLYLTARIEDGHVESEVSREAQWPKDEKVVAEELGPFLRSLE